MVTVTGPVQVTIGVRRKPLLFVAGALYWLDEGRGGRLHRWANRIVDHCVRVTT